jgi:hypothetical protein
VLDLYIPICVLIFEANTLHPLKNHKLNEKWGPLSQELSTALGDKWEAVMRASKKEA